MLHLIWRSKKREHCVHKLSPFSLPPISETTAGYIEWSVVSKPRPWRRLPHVRWCWEDSRRVQAHRGHVGWARMWWSSPMRAVSAMHVGGQAVGRQLGVPHVMVFSMAIVKACWWCWGGSWQGGEWMNLATMGTTARGERPIRNCFDDLPLGRQ